MQIAVVVHCTCWCKGITQDMRLTASSFVTRQPKTSPISFVTKQLHAHYIWSEDPICLARHHVIQLEQARKARRPSYFGLNPTRIWLVCNLSFLRALILPTLFRFAWIRRFEVGKVKLTPLCVYDPFQKNSRDIKMEIVTDSKYEIILGNKKNDVLHPNWGRWSVSQLSLDKGKVHPEQVTNSL